jgi:hypothetical protein
MMPYNTYNITKDAYVLPISRNILTDVKLGGGLNLDDPMDPMSAPLPPFAGNLLAPSAEGQPIDVSSILSSATAFIEDTSDYELTTTLYASMNAAFNYGSFEAAYSDVRSIVQKSDVIVALITQTVTGEPIPESWINWKSAQVQKRRASPVTMSGFINSYLNTAPTMFRP